MGTPLVWEYRMEQLFPQTDGLPDHCSLGEPPPRSVMAGPRFTPIRARLVLAMLPHLNDIRASMPATSSQWGMDPGIIPNILLSTCGRIYNYHSCIVGSIWYTQAESLDRAQGTFPPLQLQLGGCSDASANCMDGYTHTSTKGRQAHKVQGVHSNHMPNCKGQCVLARRQTLPPHRAIPTNTNHPRDP